MDNILIIYSICAILTAVYFTIVDIGLAPENSNLTRVLLAVMMGVLFPLFWIFITVAGGMVFYVASKNDGKLQ